MSGATYSIRMDAPLSGAVSSLAEGMCVCENATGEYVVASAANRAWAGRVAGVAREASSGGTANPVFPMQSDGVVPASATGLGAGAAGPVICNAVGALERKATPVAGDAVMGDCDPLGNLLLTIGVSPAKGVPVGGVPSGTGFIHVTAGAQDAPAKLVENADVAVGAAILPSKLAAGAAGQVLTTSGGVPTWAAPDVTQAELNAVVAAIKLPGGAAGALQFNFGGTDFGGVSGVSSGGAFLTFDSATGQIRYANGANVGRLDWTPTAARVMEIPDASGTVVVDSLPHVGSAAQNSPWSGLNGAVTLGMVDADYTATAAEYANSWLRVTGTAFTALRVLSMPNVTDGQAYKKFYDNQNGGGFALRVTNVAAGTSVDIADGFGAEVWIRSTGARRAGPDV